MDTIRDSSDLRPNVDVNPEMIVTGAQPMGAKSLGSVQVTGVDPKDAARVGSPVAEPRDKGIQVKKGEPVPVVFVRDGLPMDTRPSDLRQQRAAQRYKEDGGEFETRR